MTQEALQSQRRSDIDWLRVCAFSLLILFHASLPYVSWDWHVKDVQEWPALEEVMRFLTRWRMPLIFLISGGTIMLSLGRRSAGAFVRDRLKRILLPLVFGVLVVVPPQIYLQRLQEQDVEGSFFQFYPHFFDGFFPEGNFTWLHLWFLGYVLVLALLLLPVFLWMRSERGSALLDRGSQFVARHHLIALLAIPIFAIEVWLIPISSNRNRLIGDWYGLAFYGLLMLAGAVLYRSPALLQSMQRQRFVALGVGVVAYAVLQLEYFSGRIGLPYSETQWLALRAVSAINLVAWLIAVAGFARRFARPTPFLRYATQAVYPFYIVHQTITALAAYYLVPIDLPVQVKYLVVVIATFGGALLLYEFVIRRVAVLRLLFGMAPQRAEPVAVLNAGGIAAS
jgi:surface polysaccharide O-acyltransferase-like enzyme